MDEELKIGKLVFGKQYNEPHGLEIVAETTQYSSMSGSYKEDVYFFLNREEVVKLRDYLDRLLKSG